MKEKSDFLSVATLTWDRHIGLRKLADGETETGDIAQEFRGLPA